MSMNVGWVLLIVFVVVPSLRWSLLGGPRRRARLRGRLYGLRLGPDFEDDELGGSRAIAELRQELDSRLADIDALHGRVAELENRLDFTERLLARQADADRIGPPSH
jgi:hypothetical protein